jgi:very-short-patch-repair endonuclease
MKPIWHMTRKDRAPHRQDEQERKKNWKDHLDALHERYLASTDYIVDFQSKLRRNMTPSEKILWPLLKPKGYIAQAVVLKYIPDFANFEKRIIVEVDGSVHDSDFCRRRDAKRTEYLTAFGWTIVRFTNLEVERSAQHCIETLEQQEEAICQRRRLRSH